MLSVARRVLLLAALALLAAACGEDGGGGGGGRSDSPDPPALDGRLTYVRGGGLAGRVHRLTVEPDGRAVLATVRMGTRRFRLAPEELARLREELARVELASVPAVSRSPRPVPDAFGHEVTYQGRTVAGDDVSAPKEISPLFGELSALVDRHYDP